MANRKRHWCFTLNNYTQAELISLRNVVERGTASYVCFQPERGENDTPHLQGFISFTNARTLAGVKTAVSIRAHLEPMRGSADQAIAYCSKEESRDGGAGFAFEEYGERPSAGAGKGGGFRSDLDDVAKRARRGETLLQIAEAHPGIVIRYGNGVARLQSLYVAPRDFKTEVRWYFGPTGTGKSREAYEFANAYAPPRPAEEEGEDAVADPDPGRSYYTKMGGNKWWDGYEGQPVVIIDDYRRDLCTFSQLLLLLDRYAFRVEYKGGSREFTSKFIIITTPKSPSDTWEGRTDEDMAQLLRRIDIVKDFTPPFERPLILN